MRNIYRIWLQGVALIMVAVALGGCPSPKRIVVEGYSDAQLTRKRIMLLLPEAADVKMTDASAFGASRGITAAGAGDQIGTELRTKLTHELGQRLDSNTVLNYRDQALSGTIALNATKDFSGGQPASWDTYKRVGREGNIDFLVALNNMTLSNAPSSSGGRGKEGIETDYTLLDLQQGKVVTSGHLSISQEEIGVPGDSFARLASALVAKMPFFVGESKLK